MSQWKRQSDEKEGQIPFDIQVKITLFDHHIPDDTSSTSVHWDLPACQAPEPQVPEEKQQWQVILDLQIQL